MSQVSDVERAVPRCFVIMSFKPELRAIYEKIYKPACRQLGVECLRIDESYMPGSITTDIMYKILDADFIIADLTLLNPNVFYELAFAHAVRKPVILTTQESRDKQPFDVQSLRAFRYDESNKGKRNLRRKIDESIKTVLTTPTADFDNPIEEAMKRRGLAIRDESTAAGESTVMLDKTRLLQIIDLHKRSTSYLADIILEQTIYLQEIGVFKRNTREYTRFVYEQVMESAKDCAGFGSRRIGDMLEFLKDQFPPRKLGKVINEAQTYILNKKLSTDEKRERGKRFIEMIITAIFNEIKKEIDRLFNLPQYE
jgi:hypothetical protein